MRTLLHLLDALLWRLRGKSVRLHDDHGTPRPFLAYPSGSLIEASSHFPDWIWRAAFRLGDRGFIWLANLRREA